MADVDPRLLDLNMIESIREFARWQNGALCLEEDGILLVSGASDSPLGYSNCAIRVDPATPAALVLDRARDFFGDQQRGYTLWTRVPADDDLEREALKVGLRQVSESPWMALSTALGAKTLSDGSRLLCAKDEVGIRDAASVNRDAYQSLAFSAEEVDAIYGRPDRVLEPRNRVFVLYRGSEPVSTAMLLQSAQVGGIYWVGTREDARGHGYGEACTRAATNAAFEAGAGVVTLQATRMGEPLYRRLGFRVVGAHRWLLATAAKVATTLLAILEPFAALAVVA